MEPTLALTVIAKIRETVPDVLLSFICEYISLELLILCEPNNAQLKRRFCLLSFSEQERIIYYLCGHNETISIVGRLLSDPTDMLRRCVNGAISTSDVVSIIPNVYRKFPNVFKKTYTLPHNISIESLICLKSLWATPNTSPFKIEAVRKVDSMEKCMTILHLLRLRNTLYVCSSVLETAPKNVVEYLISLRGRRVKFLSKDIDITDMPEDRIRLLFEYLPTWSYDYDTVVDRAETISLLNLLYDNNDIVKFWYTEDAIRWAIFKFRLDILLWWEKKWNEEWLDKRIPATVIVSGQVPIAVKMWADRNGVNVLVRNGPVYNLCDE
jgi:hypothetical protein